MKFDIDSRFIEMLKVADYDKALSEFMTFVYPRFEGIKNLDLWQISDCESFGIFLAVKSIRPKIVVETGIGSGKSSLSVLSALGEGKLVSIDPMINYGNPPRHDFGFLVPDQLRQKWKIVQGRSSDVLTDTLLELGTIDIFIHDSDHSYDNVRFELREAYDHIHNGLILVDNYDWTQAPVEFSEEHKVPITKICSDMCDFFINK